MKSFLFIALFLPLSLTNIFGQSTRTIRVKPLEDTEFNNKFRFQLGDSSFFFKHDGNFTITVNNLERTGKIDFHEYFEIKRLLYFATSSNLYTFIECTNGVDGYVQTNSIDLESLEIEWTHRAGGLNLSESLIEGNSAYVGHLGFIGRIDLSNGQEVWSISNVYERYKIITFKQIETDGNSVNFKAGSRVLSFNKETGEPLN